MIRLGIDIGGSATKGALVDTHTGELVSERVRIETEAFAKPKVIIAAGFDTQDFGLPGL